LACEGDSTVTALTLDVAEEASDEEAWDWMIEANVEPFWSRLTRLDTGVLGLKKASQLALIWAVAVEPLPLEKEVVGAAEADVGAAEVAAGALALALAPDDELPLPLLQAATVTAPSSANAVAKITLTGWNRI
jgi:hypothetical protein